jgi:hypothetical protein
MYPVVRESYASEATVTGRRRWTWTP